MSEPSISVLPVKQTKLKKITLKNNELEVVLLNYGARLYQVFAPDRTGRKENVLLSYDDIHDTLSDQSFFGATVGPVAGRIRNASWGNHLLEKNSGKHHIHGGTNGWSFQFWEVEIFKSPQAVGVVFYLKDTSSGYPGPITATVTYQLEGNKLIMTTKATSNVKTICNPTNHAYFNLSGNGKRDIDTHHLQIQLDSLLLLDLDKIPTGETLDKDKLPIAFHQPNTLTEILSHYPSGLDDVFLLNNPKLTKNSLTLSEEASGRQMNIATTNKSMVLFSTTGFDADLQINGQTMHSQFGLAIEPQEIPDIVHLPDFGSITLYPGQERASQTIYEFSTLA